MKQKPKKNSDDKKRKKKKGTVYLSLYSTHLYLPLFVSPIYPNFSIYSINTISGRKKVEREQLLYIVVLVVIITQN